MKKYVVKHSDHLRRMGRTDLYQHIRKLEEALEKDRAKGLKDFFNSVEPYIQMGKSKMWRIDNIILDDYLLTKGGAE
jgi:hypothetical protein